MWWAGLVVILGLPTAAGRYGGLWSSQRRNNGPYWLLCGVPGGLVASRTSISSMPCTGYT